MSFGSNIDDRAKTPRRLRIWPIAAAALLAPQFASAQTPSAVWLAPAQKTPALVEMASAPATASTVLTYKTAAPLWSDARKIDVAQDATASSAFALTLKDWANAPLSGDRAAERHKRRLEIAAFYEAHGYDPLWRDGDHFAKAAIAALSVLQEAGRDGLDLTTAQPVKLGDGWTGVQDDSRFPRRSPNMQRRPQASASILEMYRG